MLQVIKLNEEDTTSSSRIFVKILMEDLAQGVGMKTLTEKLRSEELAPAMTGMFPTDNPKNTRFSINFFTAIGMGQLTEGLREWLKNMPKPAPVALPAKSPTTAGRERSESASSYSSYSSYSSRSRSDSRSLSRSRTPPRKAANDRSVARSRSPPRRTNGGQGSISQSRLPPRREAGALSREPRSAQVARRGRSDSYSDDSRSRSPPPAATRKRRYSTSMSPSPPPAKRAATGNARRSVSQSLSRSPPRRNDARGRSYTRSASPPKRSENAVRDRSRSPPRKRARSPSSSYDSRSRSRSPPPRARTNAARERSDSRSLSRSLTKSRSPPRRTAPSTSRVGTANGNGSTQSRGNDNTRGGGRDTVPPARKRRRNTSSPDTSRSRSRSPPARVSAKAPERKETAAVQEKSSGVGAEEDGNDYATMANSQLSSIIIVGAGPSGLLLALLLADLSPRPDITILDAAPTLNEAPRATHYGSPAIQLFRKASILEEIRRDGYMPEKICWRKLNGERICGYDRSLLHDGGLEGDGLTVYWVGRLCALLEREVKKRTGVSVKWDHKVTSLQSGLDPHDTSGSLEVEGPGGKTTTYTADYIVGCDGGNSTVRRLMHGQRNFPGFSWDVPIVATNTMIDLDRFGWEDTQFVIDPVHWFMAARIGAHEDPKQNIWRISYGEKAGLSNEELMERQEMKFEQMLPGHPKPGEYRVLNKSPYRVHQRCVERMRVGRVLLAADAAHLCNPFGGLGLTGGIVDVGALMQCFEGM
ncbi:hypothetical protein LTR33_010140 [Friedmanniomyces endolithicus]|nr:hypothetical protein LTR33_010140 [Friedmanniomyces endolithicus]